MHARTRSMQSQVHLYYETHSQSTGDKVVSEVAAVQVVLEEALLLHLKLMLHLVLVRRR